MTETEILAIKNAKLADGTITVHEIRDGEVYYAARRHGGQEWDLLRKPVDQFVALYRQAPPEGEG